MNQGNKSAVTMVSLIFSAVVVVGVAVFLVILFKNTTKATEITITDQKLVIAGMYGDTYNLSDIASVELKDSIPKILTKTNGAALGEARKGYFNLEGMGKCKLFTLSDEGPFVYILVKGQYIIVNYEDKSRTEQLYSDLSAKVNK